MSSPSRLSPEFSQRVTVAPCLFSREEMSRERKPYREGANVTSSIRPSIMLEPRRGDDSSSRR